MIRARLAKIYHALLSAKSQIAFSRVMVASVYEVLGENRSGVPK